MRVLTVYGRFGPCGLDLTLAENLCGFAGIRVVARPNYRPAPLAAALRPTLGRAPALMF